jgi:DNA invertase Pin-like site-specific DNA recombinase
MERVSAGMAAAKRRGRALGRPQALDEIQRKRAVRLHTSGYSVRAVAKTLGIGRGTAARAIASLDLFPVEHLAQ